jgi:predicted dehydrogenase
MALDYADARLMHDAWTRTDRTAMLCPPPHYMRGDRVMRRLLRDGYVGTVFHVNIRHFIEDYVDPNAPVHWRQVGHISGVNTMHVGMLFEVVQRWLGPLASVSATSATHIAVRPAAQTNQGAGQTRVDRPDSIAVAGTMANGSIIAATFCGVGRFGAEPNMVEVYGSEGTIRYLAGLDAPGSGKILIGKRTDASLHEYTITPDEEVSWRAEADFIDAVRAGKRDPEPSFLDGLHYMEVTDAIFRSVASGHAVSLPL